jgi:hypothetical protein
LPDVVCDFSNTTLHQEEEGISVKGAKGRPPTEFYKVGGTFQDGWKCVAVCPIIGRRSREKGRKTAEAILKRSSSLFKSSKLPDFLRTFVQILGSEEAYGDSARQENLSTRDAILWMGVHHQEKKGLEIFAKEIASAGTGMAPGLTTVISGRPKVTPLLRFFSYLTPKSDLKVIIETSDGHKEVWEDPLPESSNFKVTSLSALQDLETSSLKTFDDLPAAESKGTNSYRLEELAWLRSGDKGDSCNIGVIPRKEEWGPYIRSRLGAKEVKEYFKHKFHPDGECKRYNN